MFVRVSCALLLYVDPKPPCKEAQGEAASLLNDDSPMAETHPVTLDSQPHMNENILDHPAVS